MRIHAIIHAPFEELGAIETWVHQHGYMLTMTHTYQGENLPDVASFDLLIVMGGPQSSLELDKYPYLQDEVRFTKEAIAQHKAVLGICLGAQIIGESLGAKAERSPNREIGVYPIHLTNEALVDPVFKLFPDQFNVMHWHNDMPGLPEGGVLLAYSEGCPRQAFKVGDRVYGLQCHMEMTKALVQGMVEHCAGDLKPGKYVQDSATLLSHDMSEINEKIMMILDYLSALIAKEHSTKSVLVQ